MQGDKPRKSRLEHVELAAIDLTITALEAAGHTIHDAESSGNPHEIMAEAQMAAHKPYTDLSDHDREIIDQIKDLASQLSIRTSLPELLEARARIVQGGG